MVHIYFKIYRIKVTLYSIILNEWFFKYNFVEIGVIVLQIKKWYIVGTDIGVTNFFTDNELQIIFYL